MRVIDNFSCYMAYKGLNDNQVTADCGLSNGLIGKAKSGKSDLGNKTIEKILSTYLDLNRVWLLTGEGKMLKQAPRNEVEDLDKDEVEKIRQDVSNGKANLIPLIPASAFAGDVKGFAPESICREQCELIVSPVNGAEMAIPITGDSMEPDYPDGSLAYIKRINDSAFIPWGHTVILDTENGAFIKRIYPDELNNEYVWAKSINPEYPPMHIPKSCIFRIFRVLGTSRIFTTM